MEAVDLVYHHHMDGKKILGVLSVLSLKMHIHFHSMLAFVVHLIV